MLTRKIQQTGGSSYIITLPKKWIKQHSLKEQDEVNVSVRSTGELLIHPNFSQCDYQRTLNVHALALDDIAQEIIALYIASADHITIIGVKGEKKSKVKEVIGGLIGFEILEDMADSIVVQSVLSSRRITFLQTVNQICAMSEAMANEAVATFLINDKVSAQSIIDRDIEVDKLYFLMLRNFWALVQGKTTEEQVGCTLSRAIYYRKVATQFERMADHAVKIAAVAKLNKQAPPGFKKKFQQTADKILPLLKQAISFSKDIKKEGAYGALKVVNRAAAEISQLYKAAVKSDYLEAALACDSLNRLRAYTSNIAEVTIDLAILEDK